MKTGNETNGASPSAIVSLCQQAHSVKCEQHDGKSYVTLELSENDAQRVRNYLASIGQVVAAKPKQAVTAKPKRKQAIDYVCYRMQVLGECERDPMECKEPRCHFRKEANAKAGAQ